MNAAVYKDAYIWSLNAMRDIRHHVSRSNMNKSSMFVYLLRGTNILQNPAWRERKSLLKVFLSKA